MNASWDEAYWAAAAALAAWLIGLSGLILSGVTLWFLKRQLDANRQALLDAARSADAAAEAARITVAAERPWIKLTMPNSGEFRAKAAAEGFHVLGQVNVEIENVGRTPAIDVRISSVWLDGDYLMEIDKAVARNDQMAMVVGTMFPGDGASPAVTVSRASAMLEEVPHVPFLIKATYRMSGSTELYRTSHLAILRVTPTPSEDFKTWRISPYFPHLTPPT